MLTEKKKNSIIFWDIKSAETQRYIDINIFTWKKNGKGTIEL